MLFPLGRFVAVGGVMLCDSNLHSSPAIHNECRQLVEQYHDSAQMDMDRVTIYNPCLNPYLAIWQLTIAK